MIGRRSFITGLVSLVAAPAIVRAGSLMPVRVMEPDGWVKRPGARFVSVVDTSDGWSPGTLYVQGDVVYSVQFRGNVIRWRALSR